MIKVNPIQDRHLVRRIEAAERTEGGIIVPESARDVPAMGVVLESGTGKILPDGTTRPNLVHVGDHVLFGKYAGSDIEINNERLLLLREDEILGTYTEIPDPPKEEPV